VFVDSHCHLDFPDFSEEGIEKVIARAKAAGVGHMMTICTHIAKFDQVLAAAAQADFIHCTVGTHPHHAGEAEEKVFSKQDIIALSKNPKVAGLGETGLDYYYDHAPKEDQHACFTRHIEASLETNLPLVIHTRDAEEDTIRLLKDVGGGKARGVMHCFTGTQWLADEALALGFYISFSGIVTFKKSDDLRAVAKIVPADRILIETDSPYLAPMPYRGKRNEPAYVIHTAEEIARTKGIPLSEIARRTTDNFFTLFDRAKS
jgi:TatD DNase family protein